MKKSIACLFSILMGCLLAFSACGSTAQSPSDVAVSQTEAPAAANEQTSEAPAVTNEETSEAEAAVTITIQNYGSEGDKEVYNGAYERLKEKYPNLTVVDNFSPITSWGDYCNKIVALVAAGNAPDVCNLATEGARLLVSKNVVEDITDAYNNDPSFAPVRDDVHPSLIEALMVDGRIYYIPNSWNNMVIYYNTRMFAEAGLEPPKPDWTWDDFLNAAKTLTTGEGESKVWGFAIPNFNFALTPWLLTNSTAQLNADWNASNLDDPKAIESMQFVYDLVYTHKVSPQPNDPNAENTDNTNLFAAERVAMTGAGHWIINTLHANDFYDYDVQYWPRNTSSTSVMGVGALAVMKDSQNKEMAMEVIKALVDPVTAQASADMGVAIPALRSVAYSESFLAMPKNSRIFYDCLDDAASVAAPANFGEVEAIFTRHVNEFLADQKTVQQAMGDAHRELNESFLMMD